MTTTNKLNNKIILGQEGFLMNFEANIDLPNKKEIDCLFPHKVSISDFDNDSIILEEPEINSIERDVQFLETFEKLTDLRGIKKLLIFLIENHFNGERNKTLLQKLFLELHSFEKPVLLCFFPQRTDFENDSPTFFEDFDDFYLHLMNASFSKSETQKRKFILNQFIAYQFEIEREFNNFGVIQIILYQKKLKRLL